MFDCKETDLIKKCFMVSQESLLDQSDVMYSMNSSAYSEQLNTSVVMLDLHPNYGRTSRYLSDEGESECDSFNCSSIQGRTSAINSGNSSINSDVDAVTGHQMEFDEVLTTVTNDFSFITVSPDEFRSRFQNKKNSYPEATLMKPNFLEVNDIMEQIINSGSTQCLEGATLLHPLSYNVSENSSIGTKSISVDNKKRGRDTEEEQCIAINNIEMSQDIQMTADYAIAPTPAHLFQLGNVSYRDTNNIDRCEQTEPDVFKADESVITESNENAFNTPPNALKEDEEYNSFLSSRSRKIARNMSAGRRDKFREQDYGFVQPKKLFLD